MRILLHDYAGHAFPVQLSRELAARGHDVFHLYAGYNVTPRGDLDRHPHDPDTFTIAPIYIRRPLQKYNFIMRWLQEREYGRQLARCVDQIRPEVVISCQTPLDSQRSFQAAAFRTGAKFIFWVQDLIGLASQKLLQEKLGLAGRMIGNYYTRMEKHLLRRSDRIIVIADTFLDLLGSWGLDPGDISVIRNWAPIEHIRPADRNNAWSQAVSTDGGINFIYTGTLGMKHNPEHLLALALRYRDSRNTRVVVVSEGPGADWLSARKAEHHLDTLVLLPYQPFERISEVMGAADVLIALLGTAAGEYSVPSKVLSYLCAQRPILLAVPAENQAARIIRENQAGWVVPPDDIEAFLAAADTLVANPDLRRDLGINGRRYAENQFDIEKIGDRFEDILAGLS